MYKEQGTCVWIDFLFYNWYKMKAEKRMANVRKEQQNEVGGDSVVLHNCWRFGFGILFLLNIFCVLSSTCTWMAILLHINNAVLHQHFCIETWQFEGDLSHLSEWFSNNFIFYQQHYLGLWTVHHLCCCGYIMKAYVHNRRSYSLWCLQICMELQHKQRSRNNITVKSGETYRYKMV